jgi:hypothetical protein
LEIPLLRIKQGALASTLARNLTFRALRLGASEARPLLKITDPFLGDTVCDALREGRYFKTPTSWIKVALPFVGNTKGLLDGIRELTTSSYPEFETLCRNRLTGVLQSADDTNVVQALEQLERWFFLAIKDL